MRSHAISLLSLVIGACGTPDAAPVPTPAAATAPATATTPATATAPDRACLPVVSDDCDCVYPCAEGRRERDGRFTVTAEHWTTPLEAFVSDWCVDGACTPAFHVALVCTGICARRAADATCAIREGRCGTGRPDAVLDGAYQVRFRSDGEVAGALVLDAGTYHWVGRGPNASESRRRFVFVERPHGRYTVTMRVDAVGRRANELPETTLAVIDFAPDDASVPETERRMEVRNDPVRGVRRLHSVVSELETFRIETMR